MSEPIRLYDLQNSTCLCTEKKNNKILTRRNRWKGFRGLTAIHVESTVNAFHWTQIECIFSGKSGQKYINLKRWYASGKTNYTTKYYQNSSTSLSVENFNSAISLPVFAFGLLELEGLHLRLNITSFEPKWLIERNQFGAKMMNIYTLFIPARKTGSEIAELKFSTGKLNYFAITSLYCHRKVFWKLQSKLRFVCAMCAW